MEPSRATSSAEGFASCDAGEWRRILSLRDAQAVAPWMSDEIDALAEFNRRAGAGEPTLANIECLAKPGALVVIAGQQAGLFLSPLYILYKAIAAIKWSRRLCEMLARPVVPAFWIASEDHDFAEIGRVCYLDKEGREVAWNYPRDGGDATRIAGRSVFDVPIDKRILDGFLDQAATASHPTEFKEAEIARWRTHVRDSEGFEDLFARGMMDYLGAHGLVLISPRLGPIRRRAAAVLRREIEHPGRSTQIVLETGKSLAAAGGHAPLHRHGDEANFFLYREGLRCKVTVSDKQFQIAHPISGETIERLDAQALLGELENNPEHFSPNVILRPIVQDSVLPVVAMLAGPGERQYLPQVRGVYEFLGVMPSAVIPRPSAILVEPRVERQIRRCGIAPDVLSRQDWMALERAVLRSGSSVDSLAAIGKMRDALTKSLDETRAGLGDLADRPSLASALDRTGSAIESALDRLESRVEDELRREQEGTGNRLVRILASVRPFGEPQERVLSPLIPFLFNYGPNLIPWLIDILDLDEPSVQVLFMSSIQTAGPSVE